MQTKLMCLSLVSSSARALCQHLLHELPFVSWFALLHIFSHVS